MANGFLSPQVLFGGWTVNRATASFPGFKAAAEEAIKHSENRAMWAACKFPRFAPAIAKPREPAAVTVTSAVATVPTEQLPAAVAEAVARLRAAEQQRRRPGR